MRTVRSKIEPEPIDGASIVAHFLDDITVMFTTGDKPSFYGITIDVLGRTFHISNDLRVMIEDTAEEDPNNKVFLLDDDRLIDFLDDFINLRTKLLETFGA